MAGAPRRDGEGGGMMAARDEARARIAARMVEESRRGAPVAPEAAQALTGASAGTLAEERAVRPAGAGDERLRWPRAGESVGGAGTETFLDRAVRRLEARRAVCAAAAWGRTPRPGEGRAPTAAG